MADGQSRNFKTQATPHALSDFKYRIVGAERMEGGTRPPTIGFRVRRNGIAIIGYTNVQGDEFDGKIEAEVDLNSAMYIPQMLERALRMQPGTHEGLAIANEQYDREAGKWKAPRLAATLRVGRDDNGVIYLSLAHWKTSRPVIKIPLIPSALVKPLDGSDQPLPLSVASERTAHNWAKSISEMFPMGYTVNYVPPAEKGAGGGAGGRSYGGGGGNRPQQSQGGSSGGGFAGEYDDLPM